MDSQFATKAAWLGEVIWAVNSSRDEVSSIRAHEVVVVPHRTTTRVHSDNNTLKVVDEEVFIRTELNIFEY